MSLRSEQCPVSGMAGGHCPAESAAASKNGSRMGPRGCTFSGYAAPGDVHAAFGVIANPTHSEMPLLMMIDTTTCQR